MKGSLAEGGILIGGENAAAALIERDRPGLESPPRILNKVERAALRHLSPTIEITSELHSVQSCSQTARRLCRARKPPHLSSLTMILCILSLCLTYLCITVCPGPTDQSVHVGFVLCGMVLRPLLLSLSCWRCSSLSQASQCMSWLFVHTQGHGRTGCCQCEQTVQHAPDHGPPRPPRLSRDLWKVSPQPDLPVESQMKRGCVVLCAWHVTLCFLFPP